MRISVRRHDRWMWLSLLLLVAATTLAGQKLPAAPDDSQLPPAPEPQPSHATQAGPYCDLRNLGATMAATASVQALTVEQLSGTAVHVSPRIVGITLCVPHLPLINWYARFLNGPQVRAFTPLQKAHLAARNIVDPFNLLTITGESAIYVAANPHSPEGPGLKGLANDVGVSFTQDMVAEFFGTFLIPSITHQDPHYHRMPGASIRHRIAHCLAQVVWTEGDDGKDMPNYSNLVGFAAEGEINNLYVPGLHTNLPATATRYGIAMASAPIDNFITEFLPDIATHIHIEVVVVQRIINQVARGEEAAGAPLP